jgi:hypothetical protein
LPVSPLRSRSPRTIVVQLPHYLGRSAA